MRECSVCSNCYEDHIILCPKDGQALPEPIPIPIIIARKYRIDALIGRGGMGTVYKATQFGLNRSVAIKILRQELLTAGLSVEHLRHEALASSRIDHPNVVTVHDYGTLESGEEYLVMKFIKGYPLSKELRAHGQLSFDRAFGIILQVCSAIEAAHKLSIAHCDLKPDNIILEETESGDIAQVLDFGIARLLKESTEGSGGSLFGSNVFGTPVYMSPEQCEGKEIDFRTDIYSIGIIMYEMLTGQVPFTGDNPATVAHQHVNRDPISPSHFRADIIPKLENIILLSLSKRPDQRQKSAADLFNQLREAAQELSKVGLINLELLPQSVERRGTGRFRPVSLPTISKLDGTEQPTLKINKENPRITPREIKRAKEHIETLSLMPQPTAEIYNKQIVLIIDDEPGIVFLLKALIEKLNCEVLTARDGREALQIMKTNVPDLIISDVMMPEMDGYRFHEVVRNSKDFKDIPIVFLTARTHQDEKIDALMKGAEDYWSKPFDLQEVKLRIQKILNRTKQLKRLRAGQKLPNPRKD